MSNQQISEKTAQENENFVIINLERLSRVAGICDDFFGLTERFFYYYDMGYYGTIEMPYGGKSRFHSIIPFAEDEITNIQDIADGKIQSNSIEDMLAKIYEIVIKRVKQLEQEDPNLQGFSKRIRLIYFTDGYDSVIYIATVPKQKSEK